MRSYCDRVRRSRRLSFEQLEHRQLLARLLGESDLTYLGAFRLPSGTFGTSSFEYGGTALAYNPANNSLFIVGHDWDQAVAEISIPTIRTGSLSNLSTASVLQPFVNVMARVPDYTLEDTVKVGGLMVVGNQLIGTLYEYYDGDADAVDSHFKLSSLNLSTSTVTGLFQVGNQGGGFVGGYMATVPSEWQDDFGVSHLTGQAALSIISRTSAGPAAFGFNPAQLGASTAPVTELVHYPLSHPLANETTQNPLFNTTTQIRGVAFPEGSDSALFFGSHGIGPWWYGDNGDVPGMNDPARTSKGPHAYPYVYQVWAYSAQDLLQVKNGVKQPWEIQPYDVWNYEPPYAASGGNSGGVAYDETSGRIYVAQPSGDGAMPVIYVYQVGTPAPDTTPPVITSIATSPVTSSGATVTWTTNEGSDTQVEYGTTTAYGSSTSLNPAMVTSHSAQLSGLAANTLYHYRVKSRDAAGNLAVSANGTFTTRAHETVYSYDNPPPLAPSNPATTVNVSNVSQLINAINNLQSGRTISLAPGTYNLSGVTDALYIPQGISDWTIRGATGDRDDVVIRGAGMSASVDFGFWMMDSPRGIIADLTIDGVSENAIIVNPGSDDLLVHNVRIVDSNSQFIKSNPNGSDGSDRGIVEYSVFEYRTTDADDYTNGLSIHGGNGWIVRYNLFRNFLSPTGQGLAGPAVLIWNGSSNTTVIGNTFIDVARGISLGLLDKTGGFDHQGGLIANNVFTRSPSLAQSVDVPIMVADSPNTKIFHNTILNRGSYPNAIEYRFGSTTGLQIRNNLSDSAIQARDGATGTVTGNTTNASLSWFVNAAAGDLHLVSTSPVINQAAVIAEVTTDIDGQARGASPDVGADEFGGVFPNRAPWVTNDTYDVYRNVPRTVAAIGGLLANDGDPDGDDLSVQLVTGPSHGEATLNDGGSFTYIPSANYVGPDSFTYRVTDGSMMSGVATVVLKVVEETSIGTEGDDLRYLVASSDNAKLEIYDNDPSIPGATVLHSWPINSSQMLSINLLGGNDRLYVQLPPEMSGPPGGIYVEAGTGANDIWVKSGSIWIDAISSQGTLTTQVTGGSHLQTSRFSQMRLELDDTNSKVTIKPLGNISVLDELLVGAASTLDLTNNDLVLRATAANKNAIHADAQARIVSAQNGVDPSFITNWNGPGITSSSARDINVPAGFDLVGLGVIRNSDLDITTGQPGSAFTSFSGVPVSVDDVLLKYTYTGDGNLDGAVTFDDYAAMDAAFFGLVPNLGWATGDINFDSLINFDDYAVVDQAFFQQSAPLSVGQALPADVGWGEAQQCSPTNDARRIVASPSPPASSDPEADLVSDIALQSANSLSDARLSTSRRPPSRDLWDSALLDVLIW